jgi:hypothetical protein
MVPRGAVLAAVWLLGRLHPSVGHAHRRVYPGSCALSTLADLCGARIISERARDVRLRGVWCMVHGAWCMVHGAGVWWCMVAYGGVWWRMVAYGGVWWRMVAYGGGVCGGVCGCVCGRLSLYYALVFVAVRLRGCVGTQNTLFVFSIR